jgi:AcrR family transcriptional regulator
MEQGSVTPRPAAGELPSGELPSGGAAASEPVSGHSRGKARRQRAILDAARAIMAQSGEAGLTMFALASRAGVSPATPYNLFGSKQAILNAVYDEDLRDFHERYDRVASEDPLGRIFDLVDLTIQHWQSAPDFYKALLTVLSRGAGAEGCDGAWSPRRSYASQLVANLAAAGGIVDGAPLEGISATLIRILKSVGQEWVDGTLMLDQAGNELGLGYGIVLTGFLTSEFASKLAGILERYR